MFSSSYIVLACLAFATLLSICESQVSSLCRPSEVLRECGGCQKTCRDPNPVCTDTCHLGCYCDGEDLVRDDDGVCVKYEDCPKKYHKIRPPVQPICGKDEVFEHCGVCDRTCDHPNPICPAQCNRGCFCKEGLVRDLRNGQCVPEAKCPKASGITLNQPVDEECEDDEVFEHCSLCEPSCEKPNPICPAQCNRGCFCRQGLFRDLQTNRCVLRSSCTNKKNHERKEDGCEDNEIFKEYGICEPTCDDPKPISPAQCKRGCFCREEFLRDTRTNKCVPLSVCSNRKDDGKTEEECEDDEVFKHCGSCDPTCDDPMPSCPAQCKRGCFCKEEFVRDVRINECVPLSTCANIPVDGLCEDDEVFEDCNVCEPSCEDPNPICPAQCRRGCFCRQGLFRDLQTDRCVLRTSCTNKKDGRKKEKECEDDEVFKHCGICEPTCDNPKPICPAQCKRGCFCKEEFVRDVITNKCVPLSMCANIPVDELCEDDEVFEHCRACEPSCEDPNPICPAQCRRGCFCRPGFFRDLQTKRCVHRTSCTNRKDDKKKEEECEDNEVFRQCGICEPTCYSLRPPCPDPCKQGCFCREEFVRNVRTNKCVPPSKCSNIPVDGLCEDDEVFEHCRVCEPSCEDPNPVCPAQCRRGCFCKEGRFRDLQTDRCVYRTSCTNSV